MRIRSLDKAKDDWNALRNHRMEHFGFAVSNEFYQHVPFFWNREGCQLNLIGHYRGASAFLICNGPSLVSGRYDLSLLKKPGVITYGVNNGPRTIRPNLWTCVDDPKRFMKSIWLDPCITKIVPHSFAEKKFFDNEKWEEMKMVVGQCPNVVFFHRNEKFVSDRFMIEDTINWGNSGDNGGGRSVMLAAMRILFILGFRNVFLMGADFKMSETQTYHFDEQRHKGAVKGNLSTYEKLNNEYFPSLKPFFKAEGFNVYNCNTDSGLTAFDFVEYEDAIAFATSKLGDVDNERTWGMYTKPDERMKWKNEPSESQKAHLKTIAERPKTPVFIDSVKKEAVVGIKPVDQHIIKPIIKPIDLNINKPVNKPVNKIVSKIPCANVDMTIGSSSLKGNIFVRPRMPTDNGNNITIPDNGR